MIRDLKVPVMGEHASNLGGLIAQDIAQSLGNRAKAYTSKVDATLRLSTLIRNQSQISTMQLRETLFLRTLHLMRMERLISQIIRLWTGTGTGER